MKIKKWRPLVTFENDFKNLPPQIRDAVKASLEKLVENPKSGKLRFEKISGIKNPKVFTIHVTSNHSHKLSMELDGTVAVLRRVGTHKQIDKNP